MKRRRKKVYQTSLPCALLQEQPDDGHPFREREIRPKTCRKKVALGCWKLQVRVPFSDTIFPQGSNKMQSFAPAVTTNAGLIGSPTILHNHLIYHT
jgi:hypothetical protein